MPPKLDPYATPRARAADLILILFAVLAILIAIWTAPRSHADPKGTESRAVAPTIEVATR